MREAGGDGERKTEGEKRDAEENSYTLKEAVRQVTDRQGLYTSAEVSPSHVVRTFFLPPGRDVIFARLRES